VSASQQNNAAIQQANEQNRIAKENRIRKQTAEDYKILQIRKQKLSDIAVVEMEGKQARATAFTQAETIGGASVNRLMQDFFREEGRYKSQVLNNLESEAFSAQLNKEAYALNQEAQSKPVPHSNFLPTFAASSIAFAGDYYDWKTQQTQLEVAKRKSSYYGWNL
jgi:hypothetical protein